MKFFSLSATILAAAFVFPVSVVTSLQATNLSLPFNSTASIYYNEGKLTVTGYVAVAVADPIMLGRNLFSTHQILCHKTTATSPNISTLVMATIEFVASGPSSLVHALKRPSTGNITTNNVMLSNNNYVEIVVTVRQIGGVIDIAANNNTVTIGSVNIFGKFNITFTCFASTPLQHNFTNTTETYPLPVLGNFGYGPSIPSGGLLPARDANGKAIKGADGKQLCCKEGCILHKLCCVYERGGTCYRPCSATPCH